MTDIEPITRDEERELREILTRFYGTAAQHWTINLAMYEVLGRLIHTSDRCTKAMHLVPRPWNMGSPIPWVKKQVRQAVVRYFRTPDGQHYLSCMKVAANNFRVEFELASQEL